MKAIILAAGKGTRLRPYTDNKPKCMVEINGQSLLSRQLTILKSESVKPIVVIGGYLAEALEIYDIKIKINPRFNDTNMVWTLYTAIEELNDELILSYGDIVYSRNNLRKTLNSEADISVAVDMDWEQYWRARNEDPLDDAETLKMKSDNTLLELGQKPCSLADIDAQYMGLMKFSKNGVQLLKSTLEKAVKDGELRGKPVENAYMTDLLQSMIDDGHELQAVKVFGQWVEIDTVDDLHSKTTIDRVALIDNGIQI